MPLDFSDDFLIEKFDVSRESLDKLRVYQGLLCKWQGAINIVSNKSLPDSWARHFVDSIQLLPFMCEASRVADLGSGGGFPGLVLAILNPDLEVHLVDSDQRKGQFLKNVSRETLTPVQVRSERVEAVVSAIDPDVITARGFAPLIDLFDYVDELIVENPALKFLLLKGRSAQVEIDVARERYDFDCVVHGSVTDVESYILQISNVCKRDS